MKYSFHTAKSNKCSLYLIMFYDIKHNKVIAAVPNNSFLTAYVHNIIISYGKTQQRENLQKSTTFFDGVRELWSNSSLCILKVPVSFNG